MSTKQNPPRWRILFQQMNTTQGSVGARLGLLPHLVAALAQLGTSAFSEGRAAAAADYYRELVGLDPGNADLHNNFGIVLVRIGDIAGGIEQFNAALRADPAHQAARRNLELARKRLPQ